MIQLACRCCGARFPANGEQVHQRLCPACRPKDTKPKPKPKQTLKMVFVKPKSKPRKGHQP